MLNYLHLWRAGISNRWTLDTMDYTVRPKDLQDRSPEVKWLTRHNSCKNTGDWAFTTRYYNDPAPNVHGEDPGQKDDSAPVGRSGINRVDVSVDTGETWMAAHV